MSLGGSKQTSAKSPIWGLRRKPASPNVEMILDYPSKEYWNRLAATFPVERVQVRLGDFQIDYDPTTAGPREVFVKIETMNWERHLQSRISDVWKSYVMLLFYYDMGIPDDEWSIAGEQGGISYFPHFEKRHHDIKAQFDFYTDVFYYKIFSAWDTVGQLLFLIFPLTLEANEKPSFALAIKRLKDNQLALHRSLKNITNHTEFIKARKFRNDITHNFQPNSLGSNVRMPDDNMMTFGGANYTPSTVFKENVVHTLDLFAETLESVKRKIRR
jgi:Cthe_2314-like HEPN